MRKVVLTLVLLMAFAVGTASAGPLTISNITGGWTNAVPAGTTIVNAAAQGTDTIRWGTSTGSGQSGYNFTPSTGATIPSPTAFGTPFLLGTFVHVNQPITGTALTSVDYAFAFGTNGVPNAFNDTFHFVHNETPNAEPCAAGNLGPPCDDFVTVSPGILNGNIVVGPDTYYFNLLGFSQNGGATINSTFRTLEGQDNTAGLYGVVTAVPTGVPEPTSMLLLGSGLIGLAGAARRRFKK